MGSAAVYFICLSHADHVYFSFMILKLLVDYLGIKGIWDGSVDVLFILSIKT